MVFSPNRNSYFYRNFTCFIDIITTVYDVKLNSLNTMASVGNTSIYRIGVFLLLLNVLHNVRAIPHFSANTQDLVQREVDISQVPIYFENYIQCRYQICENSEDYPEEAITNVMKNTENIRDFFGVVLNSSIYDTNILASRFGEVGPIKKLCYTEYNGTFTPRVLRNAQLVWKYIINIDGYYQRFSAQICKKYQGSKKSDEPCPQFGYECRQSYTEVHLLTYEDGVVDFDKFVIPTTCNCICDL
ncbi:uncharacterized protein LOC130896423 [Diorhabda carinulata]|uniref:uncharacterized protein LOC130896423 n=1 Tax=Diorhabda carinulata TaxID=1163345 RepID=UPI0025A2C6CE|nr:uncharacterized protein LOC130896423 [Diorhabda carinulata]